MNVNQMTKAVFRSFCAYCSEGKTDTSARIGYRCTILTYI